MKLPTLRKQKPNSSAGSATITTGNMKVPQKPFYAHYCIDGHSEIDDWDFLIFKYYEYMTN